MPTRRNSASASARAAALRQRRDARGSLRPPASPTRCTGLRLLIGSWKIIAMAAAAQPPHLGLAERSRSSPSNTAVPDGSRRRAAAGPAATSRSATCPNRSRRRSRASRPAPSSNDTSATGRMRPARGVDLDASDRAPSSTAAPRLALGRDEAGQQPRADRRAGADAPASCADRPQSRSASHSRLIARIVSVSAGARPEQQQRRLLHGGARAADHQAPGRRRRHDAEPEERQAAFDHDGGRDRERELHQQRSGDVRQDGARQDARRARRRARAPPRHSRMLRADRTSP